MGDQINEEEKTNMRRYIIDIDFAKENIVSYIETFEQNFYPVFFQKRSGKKIFLWYWDKHKEYSEFLDIVIDEADTSVTIERDVKSTLILFCYFDNHRLIISSDYNYFAQHLDLKNMINEDFLHLEVWHWKVTNTSICKHISPLYPRKRYTFQLNKQEIIDIDYTPQVIAFEDILHQNFCNLNAYNTIWAEISWWKDSAFLPILAKKSLHSPFQFVSWQLHAWNIWATQWGTLGKIIAFLDLPYEYYCIKEEDYPLKNELTNDIHHPIEEIYKNCVLGEIEIFKKHGINTIFNGFWWDEAFEDRNDPTIDFTDMSDEVLWCIFTKECIDAVRTLNEHSPCICEDSIFPTSVYDALICRNNLYIQNGIRPITPYLNIDIYAYLQSLKVTKQQFFNTFYNNFDQQLIGAFDKNTNMSAYFDEFFRSEFFNNLLQASLTQSTRISSYYNIENIKKTFPHTSSCSQEVLDTYWFLLYKFVKMTIMLK